MKASEEALYATYSIMLKQGFELSNSYVMHSWGVLADILPVHQYNFTSTHFPFIAHNMTLDSFKSSVLILSEEKVLKLEIQKETYLKVMMGDIRCLLNRLGRKEHFRLVTGDETALSMGDRGHLVSFNGPAVVLHLAIN